MAFDKSPAMILLRASRKRATEHQITVFEEPLKRNMTRTVLRVRPTPCNFNGQKFYHKQKPAVIDLQARPTISPLPATV